MSQSKCKKIILLEPVDALYPLSHDRVSQPEPRPWDKQTNFGVKETQRESGKTSSKKTESSSGEQAHLCFKGNTSKYFFVLGEKKIMYLFYAFLQNINKMTTL